jgi:hypothetical protein
VFLGGAGREAFIASLAGDMAPRRAKARKGLHGKGEYPSREINTEIEYRSKITMPALAIRMRLLEYGLE